MSFIARACFGLGLLSWACTHEPAVRDAQAVPAETAATLGPVPQPSKADAAEPEAPVARAGLRSLEVPGFQAALLYAPSGSDTRPLLVATHGAGGSPEWECEYWRRLSAERVFVLCLRGTPLGSYSGFYYRDHRALEKELVAATAVARAAEPRIAPGSGLYAGFSQGSTMGTSMIGPHGAEFPYLVLIDGFQLWNIPAARAFARAGGKRVLIACGSKECAKVGKESVRWLEAGGVSARLEYAAGAGHTPAGAVMARIEGALPWLLADDALWPH